MTCSTLRVPSPAFFVILRVTSTMIAPSVVEGVKFVRTTGDS